GLTSDIADEGGRCTGGAVEGPSRGRLDARRGVPGEPNRGGVRGRGQEVPEGHVWNQVPRYRRRDPRCASRLHPRAHAHARDEGGGEIRRGPRLLSRGNRRG
ncbi:unnamed protein product, partial [Ectocarpus sp. 12 AP-2014]